MPEHLHDQTIFRSRLVTIADWLCRPTDSAFGAEEEASGHLLVFPRTGLFVERRGKDNVVADPSCVVFFNRSEPYRVAHPVPGGDDCTALRFDQHALIEFLQDDDPTVVDAPETPFRIPSVTSTHGMVLLLHNVRGALLKNRLADSLAVEEAAVSLLNQATALAARRGGRKREPKRSDTRQAHRDLVYSARVTLARKFREKVTLDDLARTVFSAPFHLARIFRDLTGITLHAYQTRLRLRHALQCLADGTDDLTRLALDLGYSSHAHFSEIFRREFNCPPSEFRRRLAGSHRTRSVATGHFRQN